MSSNKIGGQIPNNIGKIFPNLIHINVSENCLEGSLLSSMIEMQRVQTLDLSHNQFSDKLISAEFTTKNNVYTYTDKVLKLMAGLDLSGNELSGNIPPEIGNIGNISSLNLSHNLLKGTIPQSFSNLGNLESATPTTGQSANFGEDNYRGNPGLFGYVKGRSHTNLWPPLPPPSEGGENHTH
ncbi:hypothetical protein VNO77_19284 [Canavalia gladiata]|uniref:Uncharacterized protein n=1 Tax=Canavalia gladiata TaxID=3824 RepID=A0AAN9QIC8_CANGL